MRRSVCAATWLALALGLLFVLVTTFLTWAEHETYNSTSLDMAVYTQLLWNAANGRPFETTLLLQNRLHLAEHLALLLLPLAPLYGLISDPRPFLLLQQVALALAGWPVFLLARRKLGAWPAVAILAGYYGMPTLAEVALDALYPIVFAALPISGAAALALAGYRRAVFLPAALALLIEEEAALPALGIGLYLALVRPSARQVGATLALASLLWLGIGESVVMPRYHHPSTGTDETRAENHFSELRARPLAWLGRVAADRLDPDLLRSIPWTRRTVRPAECFAPGHCSALRWWLYPTAGAALLAPTTLVMAGPSAATLLLADKPGRFRRHWVAPLVPIVWLAATVGLARLRRWPLLHGTGLGLMLAASCAFFRLDSPLPLGQQYEPQDIVWSQARWELHQAGALIPPEASVIASRRGLAHLANRPDIYVFPPTDYGGGLWPPAVAPEYALLDLTNDDTARALDGPSSPLRQTPPYRVIEQTASVMLLRREGR